MRVSLLLKGRVHVIAVARDALRRAYLRGLGVACVHADLDQRGTLHRLQGLAHRVLHLAPPPALGNVDSRTHHLVHALTGETPPVALVYVSTTGVYGNCEGEWVVEERKPTPITPRGVRRLSAEGLVRRWGKAAGVTVNVLRVPGIYAADREDGGPKSRLQRRSPVLLAQEDVYTNHIHADDLARACVRALWVGQAQRVYNINDDSQLKMGDYMDTAADVYGLERPERLSRAQIQNFLSPMQLSFMSESRRMCNRRMKEELGVVLHYPTVIEGLKADAALSLNHPGVAGGLPGTPPGGP